MVFLAVVGGLVVTALVFAALVDWRARRSGTARPADGSYTPPSRRTMLGRVGSSRGASPRVSDARRDALRRGERKFWE